MRVRPPPSPVPRLMVANSRMTLRSPISRRTVSPRNFLSCGSPPIAAWPWTWLSRPIRVGPMTLQCGPMRVPAPISTPSPMMVKAPMLAPSPMTAEGSTIALAWIAAAISGIDLGAEDVGTGHLAAVDAGDAAVQGHVADLAFERDLDVQAVARHHHVGEAGIVHLHQVGQPPHVAGAAARELGQHATALRHGLDHQYAGHHRAVREVALEIGLVRGHVLVGMDPARLRVEGHHAVQQQEGVAMRKHRPDALHANGERELALGHVFSLPSACTWRASASSCLKRAALLRQLRLSMSGVPEEYSPGTSIDAVTRAIAVMVTRSQMLMWPTMPAAPPIRQ